MAIAYYYDATKNRGGDFLAGVPLSDLTEEFVTALPNHMQASIAACSFYVPAAVQAASAAQHRVRPSETKADDTTE